MAFVRAGSAASQVTARRSATIGTPPKQAAARPNRTGKGGENRAESGTVRVAGEDVDVAEARFLTCGFEEFLRLCAAQYADWNEFFAERGERILCPDQSSETQTA